MLFRLGLSRLLGTSRCSLNYQHHLSSKFTSLTSISTTNQFKISYSCPPFIPKRWHPILVIFTTSLHSIASASLCLPQSPLPTLYQHYFCLSWLSTCWPFYFAFPHHLRFINFYAVFKSSLKLAFSLVHAFPAPTNSIHARAASDST